MKICESCKTENDDTRVFCLNCRDRLLGSIPGSDPGSPITKAQIDAPRIVIAKTEKKAIPRKTGNPAKSYAGMLVSLILWAILATMAFAIYLISKPPDFREPSIGKNAVPPEGLALVLKKAAMSPGGVWMGREDSINRFLLQNVQIVATPSPIGLHSEFKRCFVNLGEDRLDFFMEQSLAGHPLYFALHIKPYSQDGRLQVRMLGASIGRLNLPSLIVPFLMDIWQPCFDSLGGIKEILNSAASVSITPQNLVVRWPGKNDS